MNYGDGEHFGDSMDCRTHLVYMNRNFIGHEGYLYASSMMVKSFRTMDEANMYIDRMNSPGAHRDCGYIVLQADHGHVVCRTEFSRDKNGVAHFGRHDTRQFATEDEAVEFRDLLQARSGMEMKNGDST